MKTINLQFIDAVLGPLVGSANDPAQLERYRNFNPDNEFHVKAVIAETLKPRFDNRPDRYKKAVKHALAYALLLDDFDFTSIFINSRIAFQPPAVIRNFFLWTWQILFLEQPVRLDYGLRDATITRDFNEPLQWGRNR